jgi:hypothetical protein
MTDEALDGPQMMGQLYGDGQCVSPQTGDPLSPCVIQTLDVIGFPSVLRNGVVGAAGITPV